MAIHKNQRTNVRRQREWQRILSGTAADVGDGEDLLIQAAPVVINHVQHVDVDCLAELNSGIVSQHQRHDGWYGWKLPACGLIV